MEERLHCGDCWPDFHGYHRHKYVLFPSTDFQTLIPVASLVAYMFVGSFKDNTGHTPPNPLIRILVVAIGPIVLNAVLLLLQFVTSVSLGPALGSCCPRFGAWMAGGVHAIAVFGLVAFFEFLWFLERWNGQRAVLGIVSIVFIQRAVNKVIISTLLTRESKSDETNRVWWSGNWFGSGNTNVSSPVREFVVKIVELNLWSGDFILGHILLFALSIPVLVPFVDKIHSTSKFHGEHSYLPRLTFHFSFSAFLAATIETNPKGSIYH